MLFLMQENETRFKFLDISKGIGMMMIVWMHIWGNKPETFTSPSINNIISSIYVPLFFILSGYLLKVETLNIKKEIIKKTKSLLRPFIVMYLFSFITSYLLHLFEIGVKHEFAWSNFLYPIYSKTFFNGPLWFLLSLYWAFLLLYLLIQICRKNETTIIISALIIGAIGYYIHDLSITLPIFIGPSLVACPLLMIGYLIKKHLSLYLQNKKFVLIAIIFGLIVFILFRVGINMQGNVYNGYYPMFIISTCAGSITILGLSFYRYTVHMVYYIIYNYIYSIPCYYTRHF